VTLPLPSHLATVPAPSYESAQYDDPYIRMGQVVDVIKPEDPRSIGKKLVEYDVQVQFRGPSGTASTTMYRATLADPLGSYPDRARRLLRSSKLNKEGIGKGAKVLLVCVGGERSQAVIITGYRDTVRDSDLGLGDVKLLDEQEYNGIGSKISEDGNYALWRSGPKDEDGNVTNKPKGVPTIKMETDGSLAMSIGSSLEADPDQYFRLDRTDQKALITSPAGLHVGKASDYMMLGTTYRQAESTMDKIVQQAWNDISNTTTACALLFAAAAAKMVVPVTGAVAAAPDLAAIALQLTRIVVAASKAAVALETFEGGAKTYLSTQNKND